LKERVKILRNTILDRMVVNNIEITFFKFINYNIYMKKKIAFILGHKIISLIILAVLIFGGYFIYQKLNTKEGSVSYTTAAVSKGMLISSISGTGQVSASSHVDIKPQVSGDIVLINAKVGQAVKQGNLLVQIDARDAARKVNEARASLENSELDLQDLLSPVDSLTLIQAEHALVDAEDSLTKLKITQTNNYQDTVEAKKKAEDNLDKAYEDAYNNVADVFLGLPDVITGLYTILFSNEISDSEPGINQSSNNMVLINSINTYIEKDNFEKYLDISEYDYDQAEDAYDKNFDDYKNTSRYSSKVDIEKLLEQTVVTTKKIADAVKSEKNMLDWWIKY